LIIMSGYFKVKGYRIPRVLLGTSPFIGAGQFGSRAFRYYLKFFGKPESVREVALKSFELGVRGVQILPYSWVYRGIESAVRDFGDEIVIVGTMLPDELEKSIDRLDKLGAIAVLVHASLVDLMSEDVLVRALRLAGRSAPITGIVTHSPAKVIPWIKKCNLEIDLVLAPLNKYGHLMDLRPDEAVNLYRELGIPIIAKKVLGAGRIEPREALEFIARSKCVDGVAIGVASVEEAEETFSIALKLINW